MSNPIDFYFDFISPFSYLAQVRLPEIARRHARELIYHPIDIPQAKIAAGNYGPSNREVAPKIKVLVADLQRWAARYGVPLVFPAGFDCLRWNAGALFAAQRGVAEAFVHEGFGRIWGRGIDPADENELRQAAQAAGLNPEELSDYSRSSLGQTEFRKACVEAHRRGVFGAPLMFVDDQVFWGNDRLDFLEEYLLTAEQGEMARP
ncbi:2-hydroxychromene-2-carboxylate isomerase [Stutzerimonas nitrititolerans]|uniref:2-hydroxychromene-2-carboxylate isomerase n=1 Tax=Stutzerimonas nitrititolerans TaxID=2482751 RepID=UPI0028B0C4D0|nr:2-hydroxychromene-2-carboxylate isomerase [Stutzerimonas nitrititolerans]